MPRRPTDRTDGRRKGYQAYRSTVAERLDPRVVAKLEAMRGRPHSKKEDNA